jgi:hypothetical protein
MTSFRAAVVQAAAVGFDLDAGVEKVARLAAEAALSSRCSPRPFCLRIPVE